MIMGKIIGIGETVFDILFKNKQPVKAVPGGSVYNSIVSLGRMGVQASFISEVGDDNIGRIILDHLHDSGVDSSAVCSFSGGKSPLALAFLNERNDADYLFYKDYPNNRLEVDFPPIEPGDIVLYGSYFVLNPVLRAKTKAFLEYAHDKGALLYYDINFRKNHVAERIKLAEALIENLEFADVVRGSADDFTYLYEMTDAEKIYREKIRFYCPNFNAGVVYGMVQQGVGRDTLAGLSQEQWDGIISCGLDFSAHACTLLENYIDKEWAANYKRK